MVTKPRVSILAQITPMELKALLTESEMANGLGNRFMVIYVERDRLLPDAPSIADDEVAPITNRLVEAVRFSQTVGEMKHTTRAQKLWRGLYESLTTDRPGLWGAMVARAAQHVIRLSMIYALLDQQEDIDIRHFKAAVAFWQY